MKFRKIFTFLLISWRIEEITCLKSKLKFTPSSLALYPLDFQDIWQSSEPIPININYSIPTFGVGDLKKRLAELKKSTDILNQKVVESDSKRRLSKSVESKADSFISLINERIHTAHQINQ